MEIKLFNCKVRLSYPLAAALTLVFIIDTTGTCLCCCIAAFLHELGHLLAMKAQKTASTSVQFSLFDINITDTYKGRRSFIGELFVILSGPFVNLMFGALSGFLYQQTQISYFQIFMYSNFGLGFFNSLPIESLDGGNAIYLLSERFFSYKTANKIVGIVSFLALVPMAVYGFLLLLRSPYNFTLLFTSCYLMCIIVFKRRKY